MSSLQRSYWARAPRWRAAAGMGAAALDMAYVAAGRYDGYWETGVNAWDIAAGTLIVKEAGGFVSTIKGSGDPVHSGNVLAASAGLHPELKKLLNGAVPETNAA